ncbi:DUF7331 family protein [Haloarcula marina]|uniref:DUF7331 family protein n=1 Tax=Haloarcula marina TaxID=2961574 RepID=UPI0020B6401D|nr:hypothetical protein [Halomicroarcula marina]
MTTETDVQTHDTTSPVDDYTALRIDGELVIYDPDNHRAWLQSTETAELRR